MTTLVQSGSHQLSIGSFQNYEANKMGHLKVLSASVSSVPCCPRGARQISVANGGGTAGAVVYFDDYCYMK